MQKPKMNWYKKAKFGDPVPHNDELQTLVQSLKTQYTGLELYAYVTNSGYVEIAQIRVPEENRNQGIGTKVIQSIKNLAQSINLPVVVRPEAESKKKKRLDDFYRGLDFVHNKGRKKDYQLSTPFAPTMYWKPPVPNQDNP